MSKRIHTTNRAPAPVGSYSQAVEIHNMIYCSGQIPLDAETNELVLGDIKSQTRKVMENIGEVLKVADLNYSNIIKSSIFLTDLEDFTFVNEVYESYFSEAPPARSCVQVSALPKGVNVEIEVIAAR